MSNTSQKLVVNNRKATKDTRFISLTQVLFVPRLGKKKVRKNKSKSSHPLLYHPIYLPNTSSLLDEQIDLDCLTISRLFLLGLDFNDRDTIELAEEAFFIYMNGHHPCLVRRGFQASKRSPFLIAAIWAWGCQYIYTVDSLRIGNILHQQLSLFVHSQCDLMTLDTLQAYRLTYLLGQIPTSILLTEVTELCFTSLQYLMFSLILNPNAIPELDPIIAIERQLLTINFGIMLYIQETPLFEAQFKTNPIESELLLRLYSHIPIDSTMSHSYLVLDQISLAIATCQSQLTPLLQRIRLLPPHLDKSKLQNYLIEANGIYQQYALLVSEIVVKATNINPTQSIDYSSYILVLDFMFEYINVLMAPSPVTLLKLDYSSSFWWDFTIESHTRIINSARRLDIRPLYHQRIPTALQSIQNLTTLQPHKPHLHSVIQDGWCLLHRLHSSPGLLGLIVSNLSSI